MLSQHFYVTGPRASLPSGRTRCLNSSFGWQVTIYKYMGSITGSAHGGSTRRATAYTPGGWAPPGRQQKGPNQKGTAVKPDPSGSPAALHTLPECSFLGPGGQPGHVHQVTETLVTSSREPSHARRAIDLGNLGDQTFPFMKISPKKYWARL